MGCDIHLYIDYDTKGYNKGELITSHFAKLYGHRDYLLFGLLTNGRVRVTDAGGSSPDPKGVPIQLSHPTLDDYSLWVNEKDTETSFEGGDVYLGTDDAKRWTSLDSWGSSKWILAEKSGIIEYDPFIHGDLINGLPPKQGDYFLWQVTHPDYHNHSWLTANELQVVVDNYAEVGNEIWGSQDNSVSAEVLAWLAALRELDSQDDVIQSRIVFWFDN